jgi:hypothetical protein
MRSLKIVNPFKKWTFHSCSTLSSNLVNCEWKLSNASLKRGKTFGEERTRYGNIVSPSTEADQGNLWFFKDVPTFQDESLGKSRLKGSREGFFASWSRMVLKAEAASVLVCFFRVWRVVIKMPRV